MKINFTFPTKTEELPKVSRKDLFDTFDSTLNEAAEKSKCYLITSDNNYDLVLLPAKFFSFMHDDDFGCIINSAVRYALGRGTYMPGVVCDFVLKYLPIIMDKTKIVIIRDLEERLTETTPHYSLWANMLAEVKKSLKESK